MAKKKKPDGKTERKPINLALQGGGSHGAFTWGVLDALLEDGRLDFRAVSGTSAGAMNAAALADGFVRDGVDGARERLELFWKAVSRKGRLTAIADTPLDYWYRQWAETLGGYAAFDVFTRYFSPYEFNPFNVNPLLDVVDDVINMDNVRSCKSFTLFISATNVVNGKVRVFSGEELTTDVVMASACLPTLYKAVEIKGIPYWDGGFGGNPALFPFFYENDIEDCLLVQINPIERHGTPITAQEIQDRMNEITFNGALLREFRAIEFVRRLKADGRLDGTKYHSIRMHRIAADEAVKDLSAASKLNADWAFIEMMRDLGKAAALDFLDEHYDAVGYQPTLDLSDELDPDILASRKKSPSGKRFMERLETVRHRLRAI